MKNFKHFIFSFLTVFILLSSSCSSNEDVSYLNSCTDPLEVMGSTKQLRKLDEDEAMPNTLIAHLYPYANFKGAPYAVLSGVAQKLRIETISLKVGQATLRIVDMDNKWVYRFAPGETVAELQLNTKNWVAILGKFRYKSNCVVFFQRPNYSGYFETACLNDGWVNGMMFDKRFTSLTLPENGAVKLVTIIGLMNEFQVFNFQSAFSGDLNYAYIIGKIPAERAYVFTAYTHIYYELIPEEEQVLIQEGKYFIVSGSSCYASLRGHRTNIIVSKESPFEYRYINEETYGLARNLDVIPENDSIFLYSDPDGFGKGIPIAYKASGHYPLVPNASYIVFPESGVQAVVVQNSEKKEFILRTESRIPDSDDTAIVSFSIAPAVDEDKALLFTSPLFQGEKFTAKEGETYGVNDSIESVVVGDSTDLYMLNNEDFNEVYSFENGSIYNNYHSLNGYKAFYNLNNLLAYITPTNCIKLFNSCTDFTQSQVICENEPENLLFLENIEKIKLIAFPKDHSKIFSVMIYREDTFDGQMVITQTTCLRKSPSPDQKITIIPNLEDQTVAYYEDSFYTGARHILIENEWIKVNDQSKHHVSVAFGRGGYLKVVDIGNVKVSKIDFNTVKLNIHMKSIYLEAGHAPVKNHHNGALWTFDDDNYRDMRILYGGNFYSEKSVSYNMQVMVFPENNNIFKAILVDRRNSIIQIYEQEKGLVPVDHTTLGGVERIITIPVDFDEVILARYSDFGEFKAKLGKSAIVKLGNNRHYSFVSSLTHELRIFSWPLLNNLKYRPEDAIAHYNAASIEKSFTVGLSGLYGFVIGKTNPVNVLYDCIITFNDCDNQTGIKRYCMRSRGIGTNYFAIPTIGVNKLNIILTTNNPEYNIKRRYAGIKIDDLYIEETTCISTPNDFYKAKFIMKEDKEVINGLDDQ